jgi:hypothetical protein
MNPKVFGWKEKFQQGMDAEDIFPSIYQGEPLVKHPSRAYDFDRADGMRVELKADQYPIDRSPNFFIERWSVVEQQKPGSLWQSVDKADVFIYFYAKSGVYFEFKDIPAVIREVEKYILTNAPKEMYIQNKGYKGMGYKIPREILKHLYNEVRPCIV